MTTKWINLSESASSLQKALLQKASAWARFEKLLAYDEATQKISPAIDFLRIRELDVLVAEPLPLCPIPPTALPLLQVHERPEGIAVYLAPLGVWTQWKKLLALLPLGMVAVLMACMREYVPAALSGLFVLVNAVVCLVVASRRAVFSVHGDHLSITTRFEPGIRGRRRRIHRDQIVALNRVGGLRIVTFREELCLFPEREPNEIARLAGLLREALHLFEEVPLRGQELRVAFTGPLWSVPTPGILGFRAGELTLRNPFQAAPFFVFSARSGPRPRWAYGSTLNVMSLEPHEIVGRSPESRPSSLVIAPSTALFLRRNYTIPAGIAGPKVRTIYFWKPVTFQVFSDNANALQAALAMFWNKNDLVGGRRL